MFNLHLAKKAFKATTFILVITFLVSLLPVKTELPKLIRHDVKDYDIYDLYYAGRTKPDIRNNDILLVESENSRNKIADQLLLLNNLEPAVIGLDIMFRSPSEDSLGDFLLNRIESQLSNLVIASIIEKDSTGKFIHKRSFFDDPSAGQKEGYINFIGADLSVTRTFAPFVKLKDSTYYSFAVRIAEKYEPERFQVLKERNKKAEAINYFGNLESFTNFTVEDLQYYSQTGQLADKIKGKIVLVGFFKKQPPYILEDLHFTPLNNIITGKSFPDMYGVVIHANILSMILSEKYIWLVPGIFSYLLSAVFIFCFTWIESYYREKKLDYASLFVLIKIIFLILLIYLFLILFSEYRIKIALYPIILCFIVKGFYKPVIEKLILLWAKIKPTSHKRQKK